MSQGRSADGGAPHNGAAGHGPGSGGPAGPNGTARRTVRLVNPRGLHPRIITPFIKTASRFASDVTVWNGDLKADGKSALEMILLVAEQGAELVVEATGPDAEEAVEPLAAILAAPGGEDYSDEDIAAGI